MGFANFAFTSLMYLSSFNSFWMIGCWLCSSNASRLLYRSKKWKIVGSSPSLAIQ